MQVYAITEKRADVRAEDARSGAADPGPAARSQAQAVLAVVPRKGARFVAKTLKFGHRQRGEQQECCKPETLRVKEAVAGTATTLKRFTPKARGSAGPILKRRCHIKITVVGRIISMGQKTNPIGLRVAVNKDWRSKWYAGKKEFGKLLTEDRKIRELLKKKLEDGVRAEDFDRARRQPLPHHHHDGPSGRGHRPQRRGNRQAQGRIEQDDRQGNLRGHRRNQDSRNSMRSSWRKTSRCNWNAAFRSVAR